MQPDPRLTALGLGLRSEVTRMQRDAGLSHDDTLRALATGTYAFARGIGLEPHQVIRFLDEWCRTLAREETPQFRNAVEGP